jgi:hypothetical protein
MTKSSSNNLIFHTFPKKNDPNKNYLVYEVWENKYPEKVAFGNKAEFNSKLLLEDELDKIITNWRKEAVDAGLSDPFLTIQGDIGNGTEIGYGYEDRRKEIPPNSKTYTIKPIFDKSISKYRAIVDDGKSLVYTSSLLSKTLRSELIILNKLLIKFFNGEYIKRPYKSPFEDSINELIVDTDKL